MILWKPIYIIIFISSKVMHIRAFREVCSSIYLTKRINYYILSYYVNPPPIRCWTLFDISSSFKLTLEISDRTSSTWDRISEISGRTLSIWDRISELSGRTPSTWVRTSEISNLTPLNWDWKSEISDITLLYAFPRLLISDNIKSIFDLKSSISERIEFIPARTSLISRVENWAHP